MAAEGKQGLHFTIKITVQFWDKRTEQDKGRHFIKTKDSIQNEEFQMSLINPLLQWQSLW